MADITPKEVARYFAYDPATGILTYKERPRSDFNSERGYRNWQDRVGTKAGRVRINRDSYKHIAVSVNGVGRLVHRLAWMIMTGDTPPKQIDHINRDATDNRWCNLRDGDGIQRKNLSMFKNNKSGICGVYWDPQTNKWTASGFYKVNGVRKKKNLGRFKKKEDAAIAAKQFRLRNGYEMGHGERK